MSARRWANLVPRIIHLTKQHGGRPPTAPAEGERRALRNLSAQYRVAAGLVREALLDGELEWVRLVDPDAGRLDDVVIGRPGRVDAYQVKWSAYKGSVTFYQLVTASDVSGKPYPAPFKLLAEGWSALRVAHPGRTIRAHYLTHDGASANDGRKADGSGDPAHLQGFIRFAWPRRATWFDPATAAFRHDWRLKIDAIKASSGLQGADLAGFLAGCQLDLGVDLDGEGIDAGDRRTADIADLAHFLADQVAKSTGAVVLSRADILRGLGWTYRFELSFRHDFPVDEHLYRPVEETVLAINEALTTHARGYISLVGPPGSGKSTTLTQTLRYRPGIRLARYYAYVRDDPSQRRGEAANFLHDLCLTLEDMLPDRRRGDDGDDLNGLRRRLGQSMGALHTEFVNSGIRTIILVDGLDHIEREQDPERSLVHELPHPDTVPEGVLFVLGTQPVALEGSQASMRPIAAQLSQAGRKLVMAPLSRASIRSIVEAVVDEALLAPGDHDRIEQMSGGHPLALAYLVKQIASCIDAAEVAALLNGSSPYTGEIEEKYTIYWSKLEAEPEVRDLLGLAARLRGAVDLSTLEILATTRALERFVVTARHFFSQDARDAWRFFHNSFRQFVLEQTSRNAFGRPDPAASADMHRRLGSAGGVAPFNSALAWERVHHLAVADEDEALMAIDHHAFFRRQFLAGRAAHDIKEDIHLCMRAAATTNAAFVVIRLMLIDKEISDRSDVLEEVDLAALELPLKSREDLPRALMDGTELLVAPAIGMRWAVMLADAGDHILANRVFDAAEPLDFLSGNERLHASGDDTDLDAWATTSWRFRSLDKVVTACRQIQVDPDMTDYAPPHEDRADANRNARHRILTKAALGILNAGREDLLAEFLSLLDAPAETLPLLVRLDVERVTRAIRGDASREEGSAAMGRIIAAAPPERLEVEQAARLADLICRLGIETGRADPYLERAATPLVVEQFHDHDKDVAGPTEPLFRQARAMAARGRPMDPATAVTDAKQPHDVGRVLFQRILLVVAGIWGEALAGTRSPPSEVVRRLGPAIRFYRRQRRETSRWLDWHYARRAAPKLFEDVLHAALAHGIECYAAVLDAFISDWDRKDARLTEWAVDDRRAIAMAAFRIDGDIGRTSSLLAAIDCDVDIFHDLHQRIEDHKSAAETWTELGDQSRARAALDGMLATSFGVYSDRDDAVARWGNAAAAVVDDDVTDDEREAAAALILSILPILHQANRGGDTDEAVVAIMAALSRNAPAPALASGLWLIDQSAARRSDVLSGLLCGQLGDGCPEIVANALFASSRLVLPFVMNPNAVLANAIQAVADGPLATHPMVAAALKRTINAVRTRVQYRGRFDALLGVAPTKSTEKPEKALATLKRADGTELGQDAIERLAATPGALAAALAGSTAKGIKWIMVIRAIPLQASRAEFARIARWLIDAEPGAKVMLELTLKAVSTGDASTADIATKAALAQSKHYGWMRSYDGGSRLAAAKCLVASDKKNGRHRALDLLVDDYVEKRMSAGELLGSIQSILHVLTEKAEPTAFWTELAPHIAALAEARENPARPPRFADAPALAAGELPIRLLLAEMAHPALPVAWEARRGLIDVLRAGDPGKFVRNGLKRKAAGTLEETAAALGTILCLAWVEPDLVGDLVLEAVNHAWNEEAALRRVAQLTLNALSKAVPPAPALRKLPAIYSLQMPPARMRGRSLRGDLQPLGEPLPDTDDSVELSNLFHDALDLIEAETGQPFAVLMRRFSQLMREVAPVAVWSAKAEEAFRQYLNAIELKVSFRRPRSIVAHHAFGRLVAELCDAGEMDWPPVALDGHILLVDALIDTADPVPRPAWVTLPTGTALGAYPREEWLAAVADAIPGERTTPDGTVIVAELTTTISLDGNGIEETRASRLAHHQMGFGKEMPSIDSFQCNYDYIASEYPGLYGDPTPGTAVVAGGPKFSQTNFLALNPALGFHLDWQVSPDGFFRWIDKNGATMVETLHWHEGNTWEGDGHSMDECASEGWLVLASAEGWRQLRRSVGSFLVQSAAGRRIAAREGGEDSAATVQDSKPLPA